MSSKQTELQKVNSKISSVQKANKSHFGRYCKLQKTQK